MKPADINNLGYLPLRHHEVNRFSIINLNRCYAARIVSDKVLTGIPGFAEGSDGALDCAYNWPIDPANGEPVSGRTFSGWAWAWPTVVVSVPSENVPSPETGSSGGSHSTVIRNVPGAEVGVEHVPNPFALLPVRSQSWAPDKRFKKDSPELPAWAGLVPKGWGCIAAAGSEEGSQEDLLFPGFFGCMAANRYNSALGTRVFDVDNDDSPDRNRWAPMHSAWRVVRPRGAKWSASGVSNALAWQLNRSGAKDKVSGFGLCYDIVTGTPVKPAPAPEDRPEPEDQPTTTEGGHHTELRDPTGSSAGVEEANPVYIPQPRGVLGAASARAGGPFDCAATGDQHQLGMTEDQEEIHPIHLPTQSLWLGKGGDAPLEFQGERYIDPGAQPYRARAYIRYDPSSGHDWAGGKGQGLWRILSESVFKISGIAIQKDLRIWDPYGDADRGTGTSTPGRVVTGGKLKTTTIIYDPTATTTRISDGTRAIGGSVIRDSVSGLLADDGRSAQSGGIVRSWHPDYGTYPIAGTTMDLAANALLMRPVDLTTGYDLRKTNRPPMNAVRQHEALSPVVGRIEALAVRPNAGFSEYTEKPGFSRFQGGTSPGYIVFSPPEVDAADLSSSYEPTNRTLSTTTITATPGAWWAAGSPRASGAGGLADCGMRWGVNDCNLRFQYSSGTTFADAFILSTTNGDATFSGDVTTSGDFELTGWRLTVSGGDLYIQNGSGEAWKNAMKIVADPEVTIYDTLNVGINEGDGSIVFPAGTLQQTHIDLNGAAGGYGIGTVGTTGTSFHRVPTKWEVYDSSDTVGTTLPTLQANTDTKITYAQYIQLGPAVAGAADSRLHIIAASAGVISSYAGTAMTLESNTSIYTQYLTTGNVNAGWLAGAPATSASDGGCYYNVQSQTMNLRAGDVTRLTITPTLATFGIALTAATWANVGTATDAVASGDLAYGLLGAARSFFDQSAATQTWYNAAGAAQIVVNAVTPAITVGGNTVWHAGNDGTGSGLDADTVDGKNPTATPAASALPLADGSGYLNSWLNTGAGSGLDADTVDTLHAVSFAILAGQAGGQTLSGGTGASEGLTLNSTAHGTKGTVSIAAGLLQANESTSKVGIGGAPYAKLQVHSTLAANEILMISNAGTYHTSIIATASPATATSDTYAWGIYGGPNNYITGEAYSVAFPLPTNVPAFRVTANNNLGSGPTGYPLSVLRTGLVGIGVATPSAGTIHLENTQVADAAYYGAYIDQTYNPSGARSNVAVGMGGLAKIASGNAQTFASLYGLIFNAQHWGTNTLTSGFGGSASMQTLAAGNTTTAIGFYCKSSNHAGGTVGWSRGVQGTAGWIYGAGNITNAAAIYAENGGGGGGGALSNHYGLYVEGITGGTTDNWAIFTNAGKVHFGGTVDLSDPLDMAYGGLGADLSGIAKGGLIAGTAAGTVGIRTVGSNDQVLIADSAESTGMKWGSVPILSDGGNGASIQLQTATDTVTCSGGSCQILDMVPQGCILVAVAARVTTTITGATTWNMSVEGDISAQLGANLALAAGTTLDGSDYTSAAGFSGLPCVFSTAPASIVITPNGGLFSGGVVRVVIWYWTITAPTS